MLEEIRQQPDALERTLTTELRRVEQFRELIARRKPRFIVLAARGTSDNAAQFGRYLLEITTGIPVSLCAPSVHTLYGAKMDYRDSVLVALSQSGESTDINAVVEAARKQGAITLGMTNETKSALARAAEHVWFVRAGKEKSVAATKTYSSQMMLMYLLAYALGARLKIDDLKKIPEAAASALRMEPEIAALSERYRFMEYSVVVGRGLNYANAFEFALKMMETCYVVAERFSSADFAHGPIALIERNFPVFVFAPSGVTWPSVQELTLRMKELHAETIVLTDRKNVEAAGAGTRVICLPDRLPELYTPIPYIIPAQLFAASLAAQKGLDPDSPRTISKVTRTM
jgi:glucosamine--fructose-6-phosphate aminotransferase (isomerizing)